MITIPSKSVNQRHLTMSVLKRNGTGLHGDSSDLFILPAVQIPQLFKSKIMPIESKINHLYNPVVMHDCQNKTKSCTFPASLLDMIPLLATKQSAKVVLPAKTEGFCRICLIS